MVKNWRNYRQKIRCLPYARYLTQNLTLRFCLNGFCEIFEN